MEAAFAGPKKIIDRIDGFDIGKIANTDPAQFEKLCATPPAIHRYGRSMARRVQELEKTLHRRRHRPRQPPRSPRLQKAAKRLAKPRDSP